MTAPLWVYRVVGAGAAEGGVSIIFDNWKYEVAAAVIVASLPPRYSAALIHSIGRGTVWTMSRAASYGAHAGKASLGWAAGTRVAQGLGAVAAGYMIGAVVGVAISQKIWGRQGGRLAMDFYTGQGKYGEYFDIVTNTTSLLNYYSSGS